MLKIYKKHQRLEPYNHPNSTKAVGIRLVWRAVVKRKLLIVSSIILFVSLIFLLKGYKNIDKVEAAWYNDSWTYRQTVAITNSGSTQTNYQKRKILRKLPKVFSLKASLNKSRQSYKKKEYYQEQTGNIEKKKSGISLIKVHNFRLNKIAIIQQVKLVAIPNANTGREGLSREGIKIEMTKEPKNKVPILIKTSANLSSWPMERMGNFTVFNISKDDTKIIDLFQGIT